MQVAIEEGFREIDLQNNNNIEWEIVLGGAILFPLFRLKIVYEVTVFWWTILNLKSCTLHHKST